MRLDVSNHLFFGDNLDVLRRHVDDESVDLIYLDPPFKSNRDYNAIFKQKSGRAPASQIKAFKDTWQWDEGSALVYRQVVEQGGPLGRQLEAFHRFLGPSDARGGNDMLAYLTMMAPRLAELHRVLKSTGSVYLHCDPTASHYLKMMMDAIFGVKNFQNEIIWYYKGAGVSPRRWGRRHDTLLWYSKSSEWYFDPDPVRDEYAATTKERFSHYIGNKREGADYGVQELNPGGKHPDDVWPIPILGPSARKRRGYPTQKPDPLIERIVLSSSREGQVVLDPFCGCGTTIEAAQRYGRRWIGIDITYIAIKEIKDRLDEEFGKVDYDVVGEPTTVEEARELALYDRFQFQLWACGLVGARGVRERTPKRGPDRGIDGELVIVDPETSETQRAIISVKSGKKELKHVTELRGTVERVGATFGLLLSLEPPNDNMRREAADAEFFEDDDGDAYPRLQIVTIEELLAGVRPKLPWAKRRRKRPATPKVATERKAAYRKATG